MSPNRRGGDVAGMGRRTSPCMASVLNLGNSPRVPITRVAEDKRKEQALGKKSLPAERDERGSRPSHGRIMQLLSMAVVPEEMGELRQRFRDASKAEDGRCCEFFCQQTRSDVGHRNGIRM